MNREWNRRVKFIMIAFMLAHSANDGFNAIFPPLLPMIREHFDLSYAQLGGFLSIFRFLGNYLQFSVGYLAYFIPSPTLMVTGLFWLSTGVLIATFANTYWSMATALSFAGIGRATYYPLSFSLLSRIFRKEILGKVTGLHMGAQSAAYLITPFLVILFANRFGWHWPLRIWSVYGIGDFRPINYRLHRGLLRAASILPDSNADSCHQHVFDFFYQGKMNMAFRWGILLINEPGNNSSESLGGNKCRSI
ncbi:MFS transporter [Thermodesulfobacteriota bacterium]